MAPIPPAGPIRPLLPPPPPESPKASFVSNAIGIGGFVILAIIVVWGLTHLFHVSTGNWLSGLFPNKSSIAVTAPATATSSEPVTLSWKYTPADKGNYALLYPCSTSTRLAIRESDAQINVACGKTFTVPATEKLTLLPTLLGTTSAKIPLSVIFIPTSATGTKAEGNTTITVHASDVAGLREIPEGTTTQDTQSSPSGHTPATTSYSAQPRPAHANGPADLSVRIVAVGVIDPGTDTFIDRAPTAGDIAAVKFDIGNVGGTPTGPWDFSAHLPTQNGYAYTSPRQASLAPGAHILNTLRFNEITLGGTFTVTADPEGRVAESTRENNTASVTIGN